MDIQVIIKDATVSSRSQPAKDGSGKTYTFFEQQAEVIGLFSYGQRIDNPVQIKISVPALDKGFPAGRYTISPESFYINFGRLAFTKFIKLTPVPAAKPAQVAA